MEVSKISRDQVLSNSFWKFLESVGVHVIQMIVTIILARLLCPDDYGLMSIVLVVITFLGLFVNSGICSYLVYMKDIKKQDIFTALVFNVFVSLILVILLFLISGEIASYYSAPILKSLICTMAIILPFNAVSSVYNAYAMKMSMFKTLFLRNTISLPISGLIALILAFSGWGVWALVLYQVSYRLLLSVIIVLSIRIDIEGEWKWNKSIMRPMLKYGGFTFLASFIGSFSDSISDLIIGKAINTEQLGYYNRGYTFPNLFMSVINAVLAEALFPAFASYNSDVAELKPKYRKTLRLLYFATFPLLLGLAACAKPLVLVVLTDKWIDAIPVIQAYCLFFCAIPFLQTSSQVYLATGHVKLRMAGELVKFFSTIVFLICFISYGIVAVVFARLLVNIILVAYSMIINKSVIKYGMMEFVIDMASPLLLSFFIFACIFPITYINLNSLFILILQVIVGLFVYLMFAKVTKIEEIYIIASFVFRKRNRK